MNFAQDLKSFEEERLNYLWYWVVTLWVNQRTKIKRETWVWDRKSTRLWCQQDMAWQWIPSSLRCPNLLPGYSTLWYEVTSWFLTSGPRNPTEWMKVPSTSVSTLKSEHVFVSKLPRDAWLQCALLFPRLRIFCCHTQVSLFILVLCLTHRVTTQYQR